MEADVNILRDVILPVSLAIIMFGMGLSLVLQDFTSIGKNPKPVVAGIVMQMILLPVVGWLIAAALGLSPVLAVGLIVLALCPGGVTSNMFSFLAKGNVALSTSLRAVVSLITPFSIPLILAPVMEVFMGDAANVELPVVKTITVLLAITVLPVLLGMFVRHKAPGFARKAENPVKIFSLVILAVIVLGLVLQVRDEIGNYFVLAGVACVLLNLTTMLLGYGLSRGLRLPDRDAVTIGVEVGIQNGTTALFVTVTLLKTPEMGIPASVYSLLMFGTGGIYAWYHSRKLTD